MVQEQQEVFKEEEVSEPSVLSRVFRGLVALAVLVGLVYLSGLDRYFFYQKTPDRVVQESVGASAIDAQELVVPLSIYILRNNEENGSERTRENVEGLVKKASQIWEQANIELDIRSIREVERSDKELAVLLDSPRAFIESVEGFDSSMVNVFLTEKLQGLNGIAFGGLLSVAVADYTTVYDFRALAHEVGHILGLNHIENPQRLMHQGANGFELSLEEVLRARAGAKRF